LFGSDDGALGHGGAERQSEDADAGEYQGDENKMMEFVDWFHEFWS
jgi:hypothetical protein